MKSGWNNFYYAQNKNYYNKGINDCLTKISIVYHYHEHSDGCYAEATCTARPVEKSSGGKTWIGYSHSSCGQEWYGRDWKDSSSGYSGNFSTYTHKYNKLVCAKSEDTIEYATIALDNT